MKRSLLLGSIVLALQTGHAIAQQDPVWELRLVAGTAIPTGAHRTAFAGAPLVGSQLGLRLTPTLDLVGSFNWQPSDAKYPTDVPRTNVLVVGNPEATRIVVDMLRLDLRGPVVRWRAGQPLDLPSPAYAATLVLDNVAHLTTDEQFRVLRWLDDVKGRIRVVSTTSDPLWPRVQVGVFNEVLYYRLNTVFVDMGKA